MKPLWDDRLDAPLASDGRAVLVGHIASRGQAERWQQSGYDIGQAVDRYSKFRARWETAADETAADEMATAFYTTEAEIARKGGVSEDDPDFGRLLSAAKFHEWA